MTILTDSVTGSGETPVLLIHGWASSGRMWDIITDAFAEELRFHALDLAGFGVSAVPVTPPTIDDHLADVIATCDAQGIRPRVVMAHSMGGLLALKLALARPDLVPLLVLIAPVVTGNFGIQGIGKQLLQMRGADTVLRASESLWDVIRKEALVKLLAGLWHPDSKRAQQIREDFMRAHPASGIEALISMAQQDMSEYLAQIQQPALIIVGSQDVTVPPQEGKLAAERLPAAQLAVLENCRHHPHDEQPEQFVAILREFLTTQYVI